VKESIESILNQTFSDFELLIFNDGSTDESRQVITAIDDARIVFIDSDQNQGYVAHLNAGLRLAKGKYIARMDADDIALPERFARQVALLEADDSIGLCGTAFEAFGLASGVAHVPLSNQEIYETMLTHCPIGHPTVMFRKAIVDQYQLAYSKDFMPAEDYNLWYDFGKVAKLQNLPDVLLRYRVHATQISAAQNECQRANADRVRVLQLTEKGFRLSEADQALYCRLLNPYTQLHRPAEFKEVLQLIKRIIQDNERLQAYPSTLFPRLFAACWTKLVNNLRAYHPAYLLPVLLQPKPIVPAFGFKAKLVFALKSMLFWKVKVPA